MYFTKDGDFIGAIDAGYEVSAIDRAGDIIRRHHRALALLWLAFASSPAQSGSLDQALAATSAAAAAFSFNKAARPASSAQRTLWFSARNLPPFGRCGCSWWNWRPMRPPAPGV